MKPIKTFLLHLMLWTAIGMAGRAVFTAIYHNMLANADASNIIRILGIGLRLDIAIAGYITIPATFIIILSLWIRNNAPVIIWRTYEGIISIVTALAFMANIGLYKYWGFPLDNTPLLYLRSSPKDAMASMSAWQTTLAICIWSICAAGMWYAAEYSMKPAKTFQKTYKTTKKTLLSITLLLLGGTLIIPIRGGFGTGTNHTGSVYFSNDMKANHAAVNPIFCFVESVTHQQDNLSAYKFMEEDVADSIFASMTKTTLRDDAIQRRPNVILICLEGFSKYIMEEAGHVKGVVPNLEKLSREGLYFTRFYASSFRTDRALVSVLSGFPAQPTMSIMDIPKKSTKLPSIASALCKEGYHSTFYYGGDVNYSNMSSYLMGTGFNNIVCEKDFTKKERISKWGVPDEFVYEQILSDARNQDIESKGPFFKAVMTLSSHEPHDVPYHGKQPTPGLNGLEYADLCLGNFIASLRNLSCWENTLVVIVPDHLGVYPDDIDNYALWRYELPLIMTGGVVRVPERNNTIGSQIDIAATILGMLGIKHDEFAFSKDLLDDKAPHFAFFTFPDAMGLVNDSTAIIYDNTSNDAPIKEGTMPDTAVLRAKAYLQKLYDQLRNL